MRGSLSPMQLLQYATTSGTAWDSTDARISPDSYRPILVAHLKKDTGVNYYRVKSKTTTGFTAKNRLNLSAFGAAAAYYYAIETTPSIHTALLSIYYGHKSKITFRNFVFAPLRTMFAQKQQSTTFGSGVGAVTIHNAWQYAGQIEVEIPQATIDKFNAYLS